MGAIFKLVGTVLFMIALLWVLVGFGMVGNAEAPRDVLDSPEGSGKLIGTLFPAVFFAALGVWCWQKPTKKH